MKVPYDEPVYRSFIIIIICFFSFEPPIFDEYVLTSK